MENGGRLASHEILAASSTISIEDVGQADNLEMHTQLLFS
jgi:hypothetical protein